MFSFYQKRKYFININIHYIYSDSFVFEEETSTYREGDFAFQTFRRSWSFLIVSHHPLPFLSIQLIASERFIAVSGLKRITNGQKSFMKRSKTLMERSFKRFD
jgi:hypothetical protein